MTDFAVQNHGTVYLLEPRTPEADEWITENLPEDVIYLGHMVAIEHRYIGEIVDGIQGDGLSIE